MDYRNYPGDQFDETRGNSTIDSPRWLEKAVEYKNSRITLALAYSVLLLINDLDRKLLTLSCLN